MPPKPKKEGVSKITIYKLDSNFSVEKALSGYKNVKDGELQGWKYEIYTRLKSTCLLPGNPW